MSAKVVTLAHIKERTLPSLPSSDAEAARRIAWPGGKIKSNKNEALRKFYERKLQRGEELTPEQRQAVQDTLGINVDEVAAVARKQEEPAEQPAAPAHAHTGVKRKAGASNHSNTNNNPKKKHATHRPHAKVQANSGHKTMLVSGRVVGPKPTHPQRTVLAPKRKRDRGSPPANTGNASPVASKIALQDKLSLPLDALVRNKRR